MTSKGAHAVPMPLPPGSSGLPVIGETLQFGKAPKEFLLKREARYGPIFRSHLFGKPTILMIGADALRFVLVTHHHHFATGAGWPKGLRLLMDGALMMKDGEEHLRLRRLLSPAFSHNALERYVGVIKQTARSYLQRWEIMREFALYDETKLLTFDVASQLLMGHELGSDISELHELFRSYTEGMEGIHPIVLLPIRWMPYGRAVKARKELIQHVVKVLRARRKNSADDALSLLLDARDDRGNPLSDKDLGAQALFLLFAGHESTASLITTTSMELCRHPDVLARAREEQENFKTDEAMSVEAIDRMTYLDRVLLEAERLYPPFTGGFRRVVKPFEFNGYCVPSNWQVFYCIAGTHHLEAVHRNAGSFDPDRFTPPNEKHARRSCALTGFGAGEHICLGKDLARLEAKVVLALLVQNYRISLIPNQRLELTFTPSIRPKDGLRVCVEPIE